MQKRGHCSYIHCKWTCVKILVNISCIYLASPNITQISHSEHFHRFSDLSWIAFVWIPIRIPSVQFHVCALCWNCCVLLQIVTGGFIWLQEQDSSVHNRIKTKFNKNSSRKFCFPYACNLTLQRQRISLLNSTSASCCYQKTIHSVAPKNLQYQIPIPYTVLISL